MAESLTRNSTSPKSSKFAPWYTVPNQNIVNVEHPCIIKNIDKGIESLGGEKKVQGLVGESQESQEKPIASLYLHPGDRTRKPTFSENVTTNNIVLKIVVPRRTGRKRKRGDPGPFQEPTTAPQTQPSLTSRDTRYLLRSLRDNVSRYEIQPVGTVCETHRFRNMLDFVTSTAGPDNKFMNKIRETILPFEYPKLKEFKIDMSKGVKQNTELIPPPRWSHVTIPFNYSYKQNPAMKQHIDSHGNVTLLNTADIPKFANQPVTFNVSTVPTGPVVDLPPESSLEAPLQRLIEAARQLIEQRPIWTRRAFHNNLPAADWEKVGTHGARFVYQYVGYMFGSGPWRDAVVRFGVDPRSDSSYGIYQTMMFMLENEPGDSRLNKLGERRTKKDKKMATNALVKNSHIFDGKNVSLDGKVWQICDITDPLLTTILSSAPLRDTCHIQADGWYHNGTMAKAKTVMKYKIQSILRSETLNDADFVNVLSRFPDIYNDETKQKAHLERGKVTPLEFRILSDMRTTAARHAYMKNAEKRVSELADNAADKESEGPDADTDLPGGEMDSRVAHSIAEFDKVDRGASKRTPAQDVEDEMDVDDDQDADEDDDSDDSTDGEGPQNNESGSDGEAGIAVSGNDEGLQDGEEDVDMVAED